MKKNGRFLQSFSVIASLELTVVLLLLLSVLVVWGTLYQVDHGIYAAQQRFFNAWFTTIAGGIPFPSVKTIIAILSVNLIASAMKKRPVSIKTAGIFITHIGVAALVASSAIASGLVQESAVTLNQGQSASETYNFSSWNLTFTVSGNAVSKVHRYGLRHLRTGQVLTIEPVGATVSINRLYKNCSTLMSPDGNQTVMALKELPPSIDEGHDIPGLAFSFTTEPGQKSGSGELYYVYAGSEQTAAFSLNGYTVTIALLPLALKLPVKIQLGSFDAQWHPGTTKAKSFKSRVRVLGKNIDREVVIEMNRPFRFGAFTFYQMGYNGEPGSYSSTLAVVKNPLRYMPYIASLIIVTGLFLHFIVKMLHALSSTKGIRRDKK